MVKLQRNALIFRHLIFKFINFAPFLTFFVNTCIVIQLVHRTPLEQSVVYSLQLRHKLGFGTINGVIITLKSACYSVIPMYGHGLHAYHTKPCPTSSLPILVLSPIAPVFKKKRRQGYAPCLSAKRLARLFFNVKKYNKKIN